MFDQPPLPPSDASRDRSTYPEVSSESLTTLLALSPDALIVVNETGLLVAVNAEVCTLFGYELIDLLEHPLERLLPARFQAAHQRHRTQYLATPHVRSMGQGLELLGRRKDGSEFPVDISLRPILLEGRLHAIAAVRDVTTQRIAEQERILQAERLDALSRFLNQMHDALIIRDPISRITSWNETAAHLYGWSTQEALGRISHTLLKTRFPVDRLLIEAALQQEGQWKGELVHTRRDGRTVLVESHQMLLHDATGQPSAILEMNHPLGEQRQREISTRIAEAERAAQLSFFQQMVDVLPSSVYVVRGNAARLVLSNQAAEAMWGAHWPPEQPMQTFLEQHGIALFDPQGRMCSPETWATIRAVQHGETIHDYQEVIRQAGGKHIPVQVHAVPLTSSSGWGQRATKETLEEEALALIIHQDVTMLKEAEYIKDEFIGIAAHELRAPLAVLKGASSMIQVQTARGHGPQLAEWQREALQEIEQATSRLANLTDELLDVTRLQAGRLLLQRTPTNLVPLVQRVATQLQALSPRHKLEVRAMDLPLVVSLDSSRIEQVLHNLLGNAIKYSPQGGTVLVTVWEDEQHTEASMSIQDEGIGIPFYQQAQIFGRFMRADNARAAGIHGSGLGLYLCRELVASHEGRLWFQSTEGTGTTFFLTLPLIAEED